MRQGQTEKPERALWAFRRAQPVRSIVTIPEGGEPPILESGRLLRPIRPRVKGRRPAQPRLKVAALAAQLACEGERMAALAADTGGLDGRKLSLAALALYVAAG